MKTITPRSDAVHLIRFSAVLWVCYLVFLAVINQIFQQPQPPRPAGTTLNTDYLYYFLFGAIAVVCLGLAYWPWVQARLKQAFVPVMNGVEATRRIRSKYPDIKVLVLTTYADDEWVFDAIQAGASGYLLKDAPRDEVIKAIRGTAEGKTYLDPSVAGKVLRQASSHRTQPATNITALLTERETEVLRLIAKGLNNKDISGILYLSEGTVRNLVSAILAKLGVADRTQAAVIAIQHGLGEG